MSEAICRVCKGLYDSDSKASNGRTSKYWCPVCRDKQGKKVNSGGVVNSGDKFHDSLSDLLICDVKLSEFNSKMNNAFHVLEDLSLTQNEFAKVGKEIQVLRKKRRYWKELDILKKSINNNTKQGEGFNKIKSWFEDVDRRKGHNKSYAKNSYKDIFGSDYSK